MDNGIILNEKELREARLRLTAFDEALATEESLRRVADGLPPEVVKQVTATMQLEREDLSDAVSAYDAAKDTGKPAHLERRADKDPGLMLIVARIAKGYSQRDLAWRLGVKEQQVQRYEADRYNSISIKNYARVAALLGVKLSAAIEPDQLFRGLDQVIDNVSKADIKKILKHGRENGWFDTNTTEEQLRRLIAENRIDFGSPALLRTGLNVVDHSEDVLLHAWRARVATRAAQMAEKGLEKYNPADTRWLAQLPKLSVLSDGPKKAQELLFANGIVLVPERQIQGLAIDGAAFMVSATPVIGLTLRRDDIGNFWFSLLHEVGHVVLHRLTGLRGGFFDQFREDSSELPDPDAQELEADAFASNLLIPSELWRRSPARIAKSPKVVEKFANDMGIHPAIVFGRIRKERNDYSLFAKKIGGKTVRKQLIEQTVKETTDAAISSST
jgi:HTH-type transcriptional regulator/antitoxin HigA